MEHTGTKQIHIDKTKIASSCFSEICFVFLFFAFTRSPEKSFIFRCSLRKFTRYPRTEKIFARCFFFSNLLTRQSDKRKQTLHSQDYFFLFLLEKIVKTWLLGMATGRTETGPILTDPMETDHPMETGPMLTDPMETDHPTETEGLESAQQQSNKDWRRC